MSDKRNEEKLTVLQKSVLRAGELRFGATEALCKRLYSADEDKRCLSAMRNYRRLTVTRGRVSRILGGSHKLFSGKDVASEAGTHILDLQGLCVDGQSVHPDVVRGNVCGASGYVMAISSFPFGCDRDEDVRILVSTDGKGWKYPKGMCDPLCRRPGQGFDYVSDPSLLFDARGALCCFTRTVSVARDGKAKIAVDMRCSEATGTWSEIFSVFDETTSAKRLERLMSPTFLRIGSEYFCWYAQGSNSEWSIQRRVSQDLLHWDEPETVAFTGLPLGERVWHLDVIEYGGGLLMVADTRAADGHRLRLLSSRDKGRLWRGGVLLAAAAPGFSERGVYRGSLVAGRDGVRLYYSGRSRSGCWRTALTEVDIEGIL